MELLGFYDTETSGLPDWHKPSHMPHQPHIVNLAAMITDLSGRKICSMDMICRADGWSIDEDAVRTHGITEEMSRKFGLPEHFVVSTFIKMWQMADLRVGHNVSFDDRMIRIALKRFTDIFDAEEFKEAPTFCTMRKSTPLVQCPPTPAMLAKGRKHYKNPTLEEAYQWATGKPMQNAHQGSSDCMATRTVFFSVLQAEPSLLPEIPRRPFNETLEKSSAPAEAPSAPPSPAPPSPAPEPTPAPSTAREDFI